MKRRMWGLRVVPPVSMTRPCMTFARLRKSTTLVAITIESETTISSLVASRLLSRWVQSDFMKTEQRVDRGITFASAPTFAASSSPMSMRASCCLKNSPVPEAHLLPEKLLTMAQRSSTV